MATSVEFITENDIVELRGKPDFRRPGGVTYGVVREKLTAPGDPRSISNVVVFEIVPDNVRSRLTSGIRTQRLSDKNLQAYGLVGAASWHVVIDPVGVKIDEDSYFLTRTGTLRGDDVNAIRTTINEMGGSAYVAMGGVGPRGMPTQSSLANLPSLPESTPKRAYNRSDMPKPPKLSKAARGGLPNESISVDLPLEFAGKITDLDPRIIDALLKQGVTTLRAAKDLVSAQDKIDAIVSLTANPNPTIDDAIEQKLLNPDIPGLIFVREPINPDSKPITHLKELYDLAQNNGEGFNTYVGLASPKAKSRLRLIDAAVDAWENYKSVPEKDPAHTITRQIQIAWGSAMTEYLNHVRPHLNNEDLTKIVAPEKIPEKFMQDGKLVFTFPKIGPK